MFYMRILIILIVSVISLLTEKSFAFSVSGSGATGSIMVRVKDTDKAEKDTTVVNDTNSVEEKMEESKTEKNAQKIILEVYKMQGNKILKDMDSNIGRVNPDPKIRIDIYSSIQKTLELRKQKVAKGEMSIESKDILVGYIEYMVNAIEKKKKNLE